MSPLTDRQASEIIFFIEMSYRALGIELSREKVVDMIKEQLDMVIPVAVHDHLMGKLQPECD